MRKINSEFIQDIENKGHKIFHVATENDDYSIEADYGAPIEGLHFVRDLIDFEKAYRYPRLRTVEAEYKTFHESRVRIGAFLKRQGYGVFQQLKPEDFPSQIHFFNGGVTNGFSSVMSYLIEFHDQMNGARKNFDGEKTGAIIVPVPTYGLFLHLLEDMVQDQNIEIIPVRRKENGSIEKQSLINAIEDRDAKDMRIIAFYDCNPNNPTGYIRQKSETIEIANIIHARSKKYVSDLEYAFETNADTAPDDLVRLSWRPQAGIMMIDDMAYEGLEYDLKNKPFSFSQVSPEIAENSVTFKGISKIGLPGARIGMMIASHEIVGQFNWPQIANEFCANSMGVDVITARYSDNEHQPKFARHKSSLRRKHKHNSAVLETLFNGLKSSPLGEREKESLVRKYSKYSGVSPDSARARLMEGLPEFYMYPNTQCGFFKIANFESLRDQSIFYLENDRFHVRGGNIQSGHSMWTVLKSFGVDTVPLAWAGAGPYSMDARISLSLKDEEIFTMYDRLREMHEYFFGAKPEVQMDYLRMPQFNR